MFSYLLKKIFGSKSDRDLKKMQPIVTKINEFELLYQELSEEELKGKTQEFKDRIKNGESLDNLLPEAFAVVKNTCRRLMGTKFIMCENESEWDMIPYDVQLVGGMALHYANIAEMATGEGKTLVATMPLYLNALTEKNCQLITVNDYLAKRDSEWMGLVFKYLGLTVGCLQNDMPPEIRKQQYNCDITYGTNSEFGFDYLRDMGMAMTEEDLVQRDYYYAIIDEVDSILIDEARTPLIISGPVAESTHQFDSLKPLVADLFSKQAHLCSRFIKEAKDTLDDENSTEDEIDDAIVKLVQVRMGMPQQRKLMRILEDGPTLKKVEKAEMFIRSDQNRGMLQDVQSDLYFVMDEKTHGADLTDKGRDGISPKAQDTFILTDFASGLLDIDNDESLSENEKTENRKEYQESFASKSEKLHNLSQLLNAYCLYEKDKQYVVQDNKVLIVDEHTGRLMPGRRFSDGLHQALEAKEGVKIERETQTLATVTIQNYFRMYEKLSGMTGTAETEANEFLQIYKLDVVVVPTNRPCQRMDSNDRIYKTKREKYNAIIDEVTECYNLGQPVLLGTASVDVSEVLSRMLKMRNIPHNVLNAKNHEREAEIVANAGQQKAITVATNMAGRGTDIKLGEGVVALGGLRVIGSERHDSRRIDRQLRGRCARQGDPGSSLFYVALEDNLMRLFGSDRIVGIMERFGFEEGEELQHSWLNRSIETAQKRVEQHHFAARKRTLEFDDVMNKQREIIYGFRQETLVTETPRDTLLDILYNEIDKRLKDSLVPREGESINSWDQEGFLLWLSSTFPIVFDENEVAVLDKNHDKVDEVKEQIYKKIEDVYLEKEKLEDPEGKIWLDRHIVMEAVDRLWQDHLHSMDYLRSTINFRAQAQKDPLIEYKKEAFNLFGILMSKINQEILRNMFRSATNLAAFENIFQNLPQDLIHQETNQFGLSEPQREDNEEEEDLEFTFVRNLPKVGRNDECPCGSGKKYKKCCGK